MSLDADLIVDRRRMRRKLTFWRVATVLVVVAAVVGGAKVSSKLDVLQHLVTKVDHLIIGGGMANTFLAARGVDVGKSLCEHDLTGTAEAIMDKADESGCTVQLRARSASAAADASSVAVGGAPTSAVTAYALRRSTPSSNGSAAACVAPDVESSARATSRISTEVC